MVLVDASHAIMYVVGDDPFIGPRGTYEPRERFNCKTKAVVYCIVCKKCGELYVGETGRALNVRFLEHRRDVLNKVANKEVASHFNQEDHNGIEDMLVGGLRKINNLMDRKREEQKIIARLGCVLGRGMNTDFNFPFLLD